MKVTEDQCKNCVVTIPSFYDQKQINETIAACRIAGLTCKRMIQEPTAAALYYAYQMYC